MYYVDSQRTLNRRESSLIVKSKVKKDQCRDIFMNTFSRDPTPRYSTDNWYSKPRLPVKSEIVTLLFESMLNNTIESWETIAEKKMPPKTVEQRKDSAANLAQPPLPPAKRRMSTVSKQTKNDSSSKSITVELSSSHQLTVWWSAPDERAIIKFHNGNLYEGNISLKCMHGHGRYQWSDGTVYMGEFKNNCITGRGKIQWKDNTWYEGDFLGNVRHGHGLYVDSRQQRSYTGQWDMGTKHGKGTMFYSDANNSYDGDWDHNIRHGYGIREYCPMSGYEGDWDFCVRDGKGIMIWPNHDFYKGGWKNGEMSGYGIYYWNHHYNHTMSCQTSNIYKGQWERGQRHGIGTLQMGYIFGCNYKGNFVQNKKHGGGVIVNNTGFILKHGDVFCDDNLIMSPNTTVSKNVMSSGLIMKPCHLNMYDTIHLLHHIQFALNNIDREDDINASLVFNYLTKNTSTDISPPPEPTALKRIMDNKSMFEFIEYEERSLKNTLKYYEDELREIYYHYSTILNKEKINFAPIMIRLYLWQLYFDCNMHSKGLTLVEIDNIFHKHRDWLSVSPHDPFETVYYWQYLQSLISVACKLYCPKELPAVKLDIIVGRSFRKFMEEDVLPGVKVHKGRLVDVTDYKECVPLKCLYKLYCSIGEPHTIRQFLCAARVSPHIANQPENIEALVTNLPNGKNAYIFGNDLWFIPDEFYDATNIIKPETEPKRRLFNLSSLASRTIIEIFAGIFPQVIEKDFVVNLDIEITYFEFFEVFVNCLEEIILIEDLELTRFEEQSRLDVPNTSVAD